jgi:hypothetical protein
VYSVALRMSILRATLLIVVATWISVGCASIGPPVPPSLELPKAPTDLRMARKGDKVVLSWTIPSRTTVHQSIRYLGETEICRSFESALKDCSTVVGVVSPPIDFEKTRKTNTNKLSATFTDTLPSAVERAHPMGGAVYSVKVQNTAGRAAGISNQARVSLVPTLPAFADFAAHPQASGVLVSWECPHNSDSLQDVNFQFRIYRRLESSPQYTKIADIPATACVEVTPRRAEEKESVSNSFLDQTFEWQQSYFYRGTVVSTIEVPGKEAVEIEGDDTPEVKIFANDLFPPAIPSGLQAVFSGPGQSAFIDLIWTPVKDVDLEGYNVYRHQAGTPIQKLNSAPVQMPALRDTQVMPGNTYFYSVSAVDQRGNESPRSDEASESVPN